TIMHYTAADNNLTPYLVSDVNEMEVVGSTNNMNLVVQLDKGGSDCKRYYLEADSDMNKINSPVLKDMGNTNMADPKVMTSFIKESMEKYPAEHYAFIIGDHGGGWHGAVEDSGSHGWMSTPTIKKALDDAEKETGKKLDVLGFDCCMMASTEVAYELKDNAKYMVGSQQNEGGNGWPYTPLLTKDKLGKLDRALGSRIDLPPDEFAKKMVTNAKTDQWSLPTLSAMDMSKMDDLAKASNSFAEQVLKTDTPNDVLKGLIRKTENFNGFKDQYHFAENIVKSDDVKDQGLKKAAKKMMASVKEAVIEEQHSYKHPNAHGLHVDTPTWGGVKKDYKELRWAKDTLWDEAMDKLNGK
ncbi:MAG: clostripain-related cysteine peptidase, partial [Vulcanimicrobiota bacterium]